MSRILICDIFNLMAEEDQGIEVATEIASTKIINILKAPDDDLFRSQLARLKQIAPESVQALKSINKFDHTFEVLRLIDTSSLPLSDVFVARAAAMFHDADLPFVAEDITEWLNQGLVDRETAHRILNQVWWHDFLGQIGEGHYTRIEDIFNLFPQENDRLVHEAIHLADVGAWPAFRYHLPEIRKRIESVQKMPVPTAKTELLGYQEIIASGRTVHSDSKIREPQPDEAFIHALVNSKTLIFSLSNIVAGKGELTSTEFLTDTEQKRLSSLGKGLGHSFRGQLCAARATAESARVWMESEVAFVLTYECLIKNQAAVIGIDDIANRFSPDGRIAGTEIPVIDSHIVVRIDNNEKLRKELALLRAFAATATKDPQEWWKNHIIYCDSDKDFSESVKSLIDKTLEVGEHNRAVISRRVEKILEKPTGLTVRGIPLEQFKAPIGDKKPNLAQGTIDRIDFIGLLSEIDLLTLEYPEIASRFRSEIQIKQKQTEEQLEKLKSQIGEPYEEDGVSHDKTYYDSEHKLFYRREENGSIWVYPADKDPTSTMKEMHTKGFRGPGDHSWTLSQNGVLFEIEDFGL